MQSDFLECNCAWLVLWSPEISVPMRLLGRNVKGLYSEIAIEKTAAAYYDYVVVFSEDPKLQLEVTYFQADY